MSESTIETLLRARIESVEERLRAACARAGRARSEVTLVAVTKTIPVSVARLLPGLGLKHLGENRPQELWKKAADLPADVCWHLIGHLQRNKIAATLPLVRWIHSVDSTRLLQALDEAGAALPAPVPILLEVNASREPAKGGFALESLTSLIPIINELKHLRVGGLMTMAAYAEHAEDCRPTFRELRRLRDRLQPELAPGHRLEHLSMGMTNDFEIAVEEGATMVRIGSALFEGLQG